MTRLHWSTDFRWPCLVCSAGLLRRRLRSRSCSRRVKKTSRSPNRRPPRRVSRRGRTTPRLTHRRFHPAAVQEHSHLRVSGSPSRMCCLTRLQLVQVPGQGLHLLPSARAYLLIDPPLFSSLARTAPMLRKPLPRSLDPRSLHRQRRRVCTPRPSCQRPGLCPQDIHSGRRHFVRVCHLHVCMSSALAATMKNTIHTTRSLTTTATITRSKRCRPGCRL